MAFTASATDIVAGLGAVDRNTANWATWNSATTLAQVNSGELLVLVLATDNVTTTDGNSTDHTGVSVGSLTLTKAREFTNGNAAAAAGVTVSIWYGIAASNIASGSTVTVNLAGSAPGNGAKAMGARRFTKGAGTTISVAGGADLANDGADTGDLQLSGLTSREYLFVHGIGGEGSTTTGMTPTGSWTANTATTTSGGGAATNVGHRWQHRILTGTATGANDPTSGMGAVDHAATLVALYEVASGTTFNQAVTATVATSPSITKQTGKLVTANVATAPSFVRQMAKAVTAAVATVPSVVKQTTRSLTATVTTSASLLAQRVFLKALTATVTSTASITRQVDKLVTASVATVPSIAKRATKTLTATVTTSANIVRQAGKTLSASAATAPTIVRQAGKNVTASVATVPSITRRVSKTISASVATVASVATSFISGGGAVFNQAITATVGTTASIVRRTGKIVAASVVAAPSVTRRVGTTLSATVGTAASVTKRVAKTLSATVSNVAGIVATFISGSIDRLSITVTEFAATVLTAVSAAVSSATTSTARVSQDTTQEGASTVTVTTSSVYTLDTTTDVL